MTDIDLQSEDDPERLRQIAALQEAEIEKLNERIALLAEEDDNSGRKRRAGCRKS